MEEQEREFHILGATGTVRAEMYKGREHLVVPVVALMEGVIHAVNAEYPEFVPFECLDENPAEWNGKPVVLGHPTKDGKQISASDPKVLETHQFGTLFQVHTDKDSKHLKMEAWIDPARLEKLGQPKLLEDVRAGNPIEVSIGAFVRTLSKEGEYNGKKYKAEWAKLTKKDHLAFLPKSRGACSLEMGCGGHRAAENFEDREYYTYELSEEGQLRTAGGPGSGNFGHSGRPGAQGGSSTSSSGGPGGMGSSASESRDPRRVDIAGRGGYREEKISSYLRTYKQMLIVDRKRVKEGKEPLYQTKLVAKEIAAALRAKAAGKTHYDPATKRFVALEDGTKEFLPQELHDLLLEFEPEEREELFEALGGPGSGNFGHGGRPGEQGGSAAGGGGGGSEAQTASYVDRKIALNTKSNAPLYQKHDLAAQAHASARDMTEIAAHSGDARDAKLALQSAEDALKATKASAAPDSFGGRSGPYLTHATEAVQHARAGDFEKAHASSKAAFNVHESAQRVLRRAYRSNKLKTLSAVEMKSAEESLDEKMQCVAQAVEKEYGSTGLASPSYAYPERIFDDHVIIRKGSKLYSVNYTHNDKVVTFTSDPVEVVKEEKYVTASQQDCSTCEGSGKLKDGTPCPGCDGNGQVKVAEAANNDEGGTSAHQLGDKDMTKETRKEMIDELVACECSGFSKNDLKMLENVTLISDERLEQFKAAADKRKADLEEKTKHETELRAAEVKIKTLQSDVERMKKAPSEEEWMKAAPASIKTLLERQQKADDEKKDILVTKLKAAQEEYTEDELKAMEVNQLERMYKMFGPAESVIDFSAARGTPRAAAAKDDVFLNPPNPYDEAIKARREGKAKPSVQ